LFALAGVLQAQGDLDGARRHYERALVIREARLDAEDTQVAVTLYRLAGVLQAQGDLDGARRHYERALAIDEAAHGPDHPEVATDLFALAGVLQAQGDLDGARHHHERALTIGEAALSPDDLQLATLHNSLAGVLQAQGDLDGARRHDERAQAIREARLGPRVGVFWRAGGPAQRYCISIYNHERWVGEISSAIAHGHRKLILRPLQDQAPSGDHVIVIGAEGDLLDSPDHSSVLLPTILRDDPRMQLLYDDVLDSGIVIGIPDSALEQLSRVSTEQPLRIRIEPRGGVALDDAGIVVGRENDLYVSFPHWPEAIEKVSYIIDDDRLNIIVTPGGDGLKLRKADVRFTRGIEYVGLPEPDIGRLQRTKGRGAVQLIVSLPYKEGEVEKVSYKLQDSFLHIVVKANQSFWPLNQGDIVFKTAPVPEDDA
jgi:tetratricopeptide (TPR) repeat protein